MATEPTAEVPGISPALLAEVQTLADEEHRLPAEIVREAVEGYLRERRWQKLFGYGEARARELGLAAADIPRLIAEYRAAHR